MKKEISLSFQTTLKSIVLSFFVAVCAFPLQTHASLFVGHELFSDTGDFLGGVVGEYSSSGIPINPSLISGLPGVRDIAISGNRLYVLSFIGRTRQYNVGVYTTSGQTLNPSLISGVSTQGAVEAIAVSGKNVFLGTDANNGTVAKYTTSGALINPSLITGLQSPFGLLGDLAISGGNLFVASYGTEGTVGQYTLSGAAINPALITADGATTTALAVIGSRIFVRNSSSAEEFGVDTIGEYTTSGALVNPLFITGLTNPYGIAISEGDLFVAEIGLGGGEGVVGKYNLSGEPIDPALITGLDSPSIAVSGPTTSVPDQVSTLWLAVPTAVLFGRKRLLGYRGKRA